MSDNDDDAFEIAVEQANKLNNFTFTPVDDEDVLRAIVRAFAEALVEQGACRPAAHRRDHRATWRAENDRILEDFMANLRRPS